MKKLTQLVPDVREALQTALEEAAEAVVIDLKKAGPYWSGQFESLWQVNAGKTAVPADIPTLPPTPPFALPRTVTDGFDIPESPNLEGYTIGNRARYRLYAMDVLPTPRGRQQGEAPNKTAEKYWYDTYRNSKLRNTVDRTLVNVFRRYK